MIARSPPLLIQRALLLDGQRGLDPACIDQVVAFQRSARRRILLLARQPMRWRPTRNSVDEDLGLQQLLHQALRRAGAEFDGVLYLTVGFFARRQARLDELAELARRYRIEPAELVAVGSDATLLESIVQSGGRALAVGEKITGASQHASLKTALAALS